MPSRPPDLRPAVLLAAVSLTVGVGVLGLVRVTPGGPSKASVVGERPSTYAGQVAALAALHAWDEDRATAWSDGSATRLADLYLPGSSAGRQDVALLARYRRRGFVVTGMRTQVLDLSVLAHRPGRWTLQVTDRLATATATGVVAAGTSGPRRPRATVPLPRDAASSRELTLVRGDDGRWRVGAVRDVLRPGRR